MNHTLAKEEPALIIDIGLGLVGFVLSIIWGKLSRTRMTAGTIRLLAGLWIGIAVFGMILAFVMQSAAPNKRPQSGYETLFRLGDALKSNRLSLLLDGVGLLPEGGAVAGGFSFWHGAAGVSNGIENLQAVKMGAGLIGTASCANDGNLLGSATGAASIGVALVKAAPIYGQVLSGISLAGDLYKTV